MGASTWLSKQLQYFKTASHQICFLIVLFSLVSFCGAQETEQVSHPITLNPQNDTNIAGKSAPHVFEIKTDTEDIHIASSGIQVLEDNSGKLMFEQVSKEPLIDSFQLNTARKYNFSAYAF